MIKLEGWATFPGSGSDAMNYTDALAPHLFPPHEAMVAAVDLVENVTHLPAEVAVPDGGDLTTAGFAIPHEIQIARATIVILSALLGIPANLCLLFTITCSRFLRNDKDNIMVFHMAAVSLFSCGVLAPLHGATLALGEWGLGEEACQAAGYLFSLANQVIIWTIVLITVNRYRIIAKPLRCSNAASASSLGPSFIVVWLLALTFSALPWFMTRGYTYELLDGACVLHNRQDKVIYPYLWVLHMILTFYVPPGIVCLCYYQIYKISNRQSKRLSALVHLVTTLTHTVASTAAIKKTPQSSLFGRKAPTTVAKYLGSFLVVYLPYSVVTLFEAILGANGTGNVVIGGFRLIASTLLHVSPCVHAILYGIYNRMMWDTFVYHVRRKVLTPAMSRNQHPRHRDDLPRPPVLVLSRSRNSRSGGASCADTRNNLSLPDLHKEGVTNSLLAPDPRVPRAVSLTEVLIAHECHDV